MTTYPLDPELAAALPMLPEADCSDIEGARAEAVAGIDALLEGVDTTGVDVFEVVAPGPEGAPDVVLRGYRPQGVEGPLPVIYDIHGGGFILGSVDFDHGTNTEFARELGAAVFSVEYRLAPENPYPAGLEDAYAGLVHLTKNAAELGIDPARIVLYGISAGGGIAAGLALLARDRGGPAITFQYLGVPELDDRLDTPSMRAFTDTPLWNRPNAVISWDAYLGTGVPGSAGVPVYAAPARATAEQLAGLPPAYVSVMEFDPLRDEGIDYARALLAAGVSVELHLFPGTFHGSALVPHAEVSQREAAEAVAVLRKAL
ncbi:alpha/beta hydrolase [Streptomyces sp. NBC_00878]|uniref:alpha/beta hydrolase n=1 Tax=Streptomyces sp. NBC_00878 TaxID=2975854 RepID=UPI00225C10D3|nr:alpha/beta hydrolase [Streptomyces sp. NBC_00878]MCX4908374.1 alpha/beta hydrolase [Streptomyces sp. NBC_00878]